MPTPKLTAPETIPAFGSCTVQVSIKDFSDRGILAEAHRRRLIASGPAELIEAATALLLKIENMTTEEFSCGEEKAEREALQAALVRIAGADLSEAA